MIIETKQKISDRKGNGSGYKPEFVVHVERQTPSNAEAEQAVLGSILLDATAAVEEGKKPNSRIVELFSRVVAVLQPSDFYYEKHRWLFESILALKANHEPIDFLSVTSELDKRGHLNALGGAAYVTSLLNAVPSALHMEHYARLVHDAAVERNLLKASTDIAEIAVDSDVEIGSKLAKARAALEEVERDAKSDAFQVLRISDLGEFEAPTEVVDNLFQVPSLNLLVGESGGGKTWTLMEGVYRVSLGQKWLGLETKRTPILIVDTESGRRRIKNRMRAIELGANGAFGEDSYVITDRMINLNLGGIGKLGDEAARHRDLLKDAIFQTGAGLVIVDAFADVAQGADENAAQGVMPTLNALREIANETCSAIVCIHHTNRNGSSKGGNYRGSSAIKGAVDVMLEMQMVPTSNGFVARFETTKQRDGKPLQAFARAVFHEVLRDPSDFNSLVTAFSVEPATESDFDTDARAILDVLQGEMSVSEIQNKLVDVEIAPRTLTRKLGHLVKNKAILRTGESKRTTRYHRIAER